MDDTEPSAAIGSSVVMKNFIKLKGSELFHAVPEIVHDSLAVSKIDEITVSFKLECIKFSFSITKTRLLVIVELQELEQEHSKPLSHLQNIIRNWSAVKC